jgi:hypothetical protein
VHLVTSDAIIRRITLALEIDEHPLMVLGDRVQLQQVLLNLIVNALEAIDEHAEQRIVRAYCQRTIEQRIRIMVSDSGAGLPVGAEDLVFDSVSTRPSLKDGDGAVHRQVDSRDAWRYHPCAERAGQRSGRRILAAVSRFGSHGLIARADLLGW